MMNTYINSEFKIFKFILPNESLSEGKEEKEEENDEEEEKRRRRKGC